MAKGLYFGDTLLTVSIKYNKQWHFVYTHESIIALDDSLVINIALVLYLPLDSHLKLHNSYKFVAVLLGVYTSKSA